ncbi:hypothetical protein NFX31_06645 [Microbacterium azadirachtae]|uniref:hypothetical protein n=1 Tax=Microbacterium azadirachtae TaxID=582680 RepID=UPI0021D4F2CD|nr:hypothetical protein [Microbacterium azadirachtae]UXW87191.1 hypothetical protein NFX31_06645 [Microbacterium azadirachtae]
MALASMIAPAADTDDRVADVLRLRREITRMQRRRSDLPLIPVPTALEPILPEGGLQVGTAYSLSPSPGLIGALLAGASRTGAWCAAVGMPTLGVEALAGHGVDLERLLLVPAPGARWLSVVSALSEVIPLIAVRPSTAVREAELSRLNARLRDRGCTLLVVSGTVAGTPDAGFAGWPQSEGSIRVHDPCWQGLGDGWGVLEECEVTVTAHTRRSPIPQSVRVRLPDPHGRVESGAPGEVEVIAPVTPRLVPLPSASADPRPPAAADARPSVAAPELLAVAG